MRLTLLSLLAALAPSFVFADVQFTSPAAGGSIPAGAITVKWAESGTAPSIGLLSSYSLTLMVGGNTDSDAVGVLYLQNSWRDGKGMKDVGRGGGCLDDMD